MYKELHVSLSIEECLKIIKDEFDGTVCDEYVRKYNDKRIVTILFRPYTIWRDFKPVLSIVLDNFDEHTKIYATITGREKFIRLIDQSFEKYKI